MDPYYKVKLSKGKAELIPFENRDAHNLYDIRLRLSFIIHELNGASFDGWSVYYDGNIDKVKLFLIEQFAEGVFEFEYE